MKIDILHRDDLDISRQAWCLSRTADSARHWSEVFTIDVPVNELAGAVVHLHGFTILEREIFSSLRNHVMWARTSHVDDPAAFTVPPELVSLSNDLARSAMIQERDAGGPQDEWRRHLPMMSETAWTTRISFRDALKLVRYFTFLEEFATEPLDVRFGDVAKAIFDLVVSFTGDHAAAIKAIDATQFAKFLHEGDVAVTSNDVLAANSSNFYVFTLDMPLWLRAQVVRHRPLAFVDTLFRDFIVHKDALYKTIEAPIRMEVSVTQDFWRSVMSKRSCWLAQDALTGGRKDPWQMILDQFGFREEMLPCADGRCPYHGDARHRLDGSDPGVPCPIFCDITGVDKAPHRANMLEAAASRHPFWKERIGS